MDWKVRVDVDVRMTTVTTLPPTGEIQQYCVLAIYESKHWNYVDLSTIVRQGTSSFISEFSVGTIALLREWDELISKRFPHEHDTPLFSHVKERWYESIWRKYFVQLRRKVIKLLYLLDVLRFLSANKIYYNNI
jgi:hypothetical protein